MITISEVAHAYILKELEEHLPRKENELDDRGNVPHVRLGVQEYNEEWGGYRYLFFEDVTQEGDLLLDFTDYIVLVHQEHAPVINGLYIDYRREGLQKRLDFINPNGYYLGPVCGCGTATQFDNVKHIGLENPPPLDMEALLNNTTVEEDEDIVSESEGS